MWSPDSQKIAYLDNSQALYGSTSRPARRRRSGGADLRAGPHDAGRWSPDSKWLAYTLNTSAAIQSVRVYSIDQDKSFPITDGLSEVTDPVFDKSGKYLFFLASTDAGPVKDWFAQSNADTRDDAGDLPRRAPNDLPSPLAQGERRGEGEAADERRRQRRRRIRCPGLRATTRQRSARGDKPAAGAAVGEKPGADVKSEAGAAAKKPAVVRIDFDGLPYRILDLPIPVGEYSSLQPATTGRSSTCARPTASRRCSAST